MTNFTRYTAENAPAGSKPILEGVQSAWKFIPNLHATLAESPLALEVHNYLFDAFDKSSFTPAERQIILMTASYENNCEYCMAGHSALAKMAQVPEDAWNAIRQGKPIPNAKLEALHKFAGEVVAKKGWVDETAASGFLAAGYSKAQMLELLIAVSLKVMASYTNHFAHTPLDDFQKATAWTHPTRKAA
jgi:AhpD family alkylhydroperoxidase